MDDIVSRSASAKDAIKQLLALTTNELIRDTQHKGCFLINAAIEVAPHDTEVNNLIDQNDRQVEEFFYSALKKGQENGEISPGKDAKGLARFIFNTVKGIRVSAKSKNDKLVFDDIIKLTLSVLD